MELAMIGLGKMGLNMATRLARGGHRVVGFAPSAESVQAAIDHGVEGTHSLEEAVGKLKAPRIVWVMVPAGQITDETIEKVFLSGGSCRIPGFQKVLEAETGISVAELNPFANLQISEKLFDPKYLSYMAPQAAVAVGLALRSIGDK